MSWLYPITHNIPWFIRTPAIALLGTECYTYLIYDLQFDHITCLKYGISKALSLAIVTGSGVVKIPQIFKILRSKSARGLSLSSFILDTIGLIIIVGYNFRHEFALSTYGESFLLLIQNVIIMFFIVTFSQHPQAILIALLTLIIPILILVLILIPSSPIPLSLLQGMLTLTIPLSISSKIPQIIINHTKKSTGQLSFFLVFSSFLGCLARLFTTITETGDQTLLLNFGSGTILNGVLTLQMLRYWKSPSNSNLEHEIELNSTTTAINQSSSSTQPRINLNKPKQWTRKAD
ncbi:hypothetical protein CROQUDRAFT_41757 [Cronartium quercuum f. sp. fusiforme G11]|uniref:Mannose-P-dolichol utilization defect 1 protein homolog n=1 Tax=Cronartium quercuum f. sp. fusiforme G11 TaxID=708437 RepID=A0A9P6NLI7_9BASI|nr:hypothetical protein CROQUDRAFT_41757 [Cronartium quercuum f. sp. fusiforme G11]